MKSLFSFLLFVLLTSSVQAQLINDNPHQYGALSAKLLVIDYGMANEELEDTELSFGVELGYRQQLGKLFGLAVPLKIGVIDVGERENLNFVSVDLLAHIYPAGSQVKLAPYLLGGIGAVSEEFDNTNTQIPLGAGLNWKVGDHSFINLQGEYRISNVDLRDNIQLGLGYIYAFTNTDADGDGVPNKLDQCPNQVGTAATNGCPDTDLDGIIDSKDKCPTVPGEAKLMGCPDTDMDGIADAEDQCPEEAGTAATMGCPDTDGDGVADKDDACPEKPGAADQQGCPDTDGDGFYDHQDKCPDQAGPEMGCPPADRDGDGVADKDDECPDAAGSLRGCPDSDDDLIADKDDRCPNSAGPASNQGCPEVKREVKEILEFATQSVQFETSSAKLKSESYFTLGQIVEIMNNYPDYSLIISGHTDNVGVAENNQILSEKRARTCRDYLIGKGIDASRITYVGYGETRPRESNETSSGRRLNRRVEFDLRLL